MNQPPISPAMLLPGATPAAAPMAAAAAPKMAPFMAPPPPDGALTNDQRRRKALALALTSAGPVGAGASSIEGFGNALSKGVNAYIANKPENPMHNPMNWIPTVTPGQ